MTEEQWRQEFAKKLRYKMNSQSVSQKELSDLSGVSETSISRYLAGTQEPKVYALTQIARALKASIFELIPINR